MNRTGRSMLLFLLGVVTLRLVWSGGYSWFVQGRMRTPLLVSAVLVIGLALLDLVIEAREHERDPETSRRRVGPGVGWLLALPVLVHVVVSPTALGAAAANRTEAYIPTEQASPFTPLAVGSAPEKLRVYDFLKRAIWDDEHSLEGLDIELEGLVVNRPGAPDGFVLTRFLVSCCAADGVPLQVTIHAPGTTLPDDTWVRVVVRWRPPTIPYTEQADGIVVEAEASSVVVAPVAGDPYETPY